MGACKEDEPLYWAVLITPVWTLSVEIVFYALAPFIVRKRLSVLIPLTVLLCLLRLVLPLAGIDRLPFSRGLLPLEMSYFLLGVLAYRFKWHTRASAWLMGLLVLATVGMHVIPGYIPENESAAWWAYLLLLVVLIPAIFETSKNWSVDRILGELSYPIYIAHFVTLSIVSLMPGHGTWMQLAACVAVAYVSYKVVCEPIDAFRSRYRLSAAANR